MNTIRGSRGAMYVVVVTVSTNFANLYRLRGSSTYLKVAVLDAHLPVYSFFRIRKLSV